LKPHLYLLDGMALAYRAYFALIRNPISTSQGVNTSALYGFVNTLLDLRDSGQPTHLAIAMDTDAPTERHRLYPAYKAQREEMPEDLSRALPAIDRFAAAFRIPVLRMDGYEADDLIGTLARRAEAEGFSVTMVTPDKDFGQIVTAAIQILRPGRMGNPPEIWGETEVCERWGIRRVDQVRDILGLMGDASDNIPGVPGIGEKTAAKLIADFDTVEQLLERVGELKGKQRERIEAHSEQALLSKRLATIDTAVPVEVEWEALRLEEPDEEALKALCVEFEFNAIGRRLLGESFKAGRGFAAQPVAGELFAPAEVESRADGGAAGKGARPEGASLRRLADTPHDYRMIESWEALDRLLAEMQAQPAICFDLETDALDPRVAEVLGVAVAWQAGCACYIILPTDPVEREKWLAAVVATLGNRSMLKVGHHLKFDLGVLRWRGHRLEGPFFDTMIAHALLEPDKRHGMDTLAEQYLGYSPITLESLIGPKGNAQRSTRDLPPALLGEYAAEDADVTWQLREKFAPLLAAHGLETVFRDVECPLIPVLVEMEWHGIQIDSTVLADFSIELGKITDQLRGEIFDLAGVTFNLNSPKQLGEVFFDRLKLLEKPKRTRTGQYVTNEQVLETLAADHAIARKVLEYREITKLRSTYVDALPQAVFPATGRIHTSYSQMVTATGRLASQNPNLQNIPIRTDRGREIRRAFVAADGFQLLAADYSQIELRIMASLSGDTALQEAFRSGLDVHTATAAAIHGVDPSAVDGEMRRRAKMVNFGIIYGISAFGLAQRLGIPRTMAGEIIESYFTQYPGVRTYMEQTVEMARDKGYVETLTGRRRYLADLRSANAAVRSGAERMAINTPVQGTAADMIKLAMRRVQDWLWQEETRSRLLLQVHDELVLEVVPEESATVTSAVVRLMEGALPLAVPVVVETGIGENWLAGHA